MLDKDSYLKAFHADTTALADAAGLGPQAPLPSCPGWTVATLLGHLGAIYLSIAKNIRVGEGEDVVQELADLELAPDYEEWFKQDFALARLPPGAVEWYRQSAADLEAAFRAAQPGERTWSWWPPDQTVGFWMRRMAQETAVHRWDAQLAFDRAEPIERDLALDGIDEALTIYQPQWCRPKAEVLGTGETYRFAPSDGSESWVVRFAGDGMEVHRGAGEADVVIRGPASDLLLFLWHRIPAGRVQVEGPSALVDRYFELVPPD